MSLNNYWLYCVLGRSTGVVTTARLTHATPASSYANSANRDWEYDAILRETNVTGNCKDIAYQLVYDNSYIQVHYLHHNYIIWEIFLVLKIHEIFANDS